MDPQIGDQLYSIFQEGYHRAATSGNPSVPGAGVMNPPGSYNGYLAGINPLLENEFPATHQPNTFGSNNGWNHYNGNEVDFTAVARGANFSNPNAQQFHQNEFYNGSIDLNPSLLNFGSYPPEMLSSEPFNPSASAVPSTTATSPILSSIPVADTYGNGWPKHEPLTAFGGQEDSKNMFPSGTNDTPLHTSFFDNPQSNKLSVASPGSSHPGSPLSPATTMGSMGDSAYSENPRKRGASSGGRSSSQGGAGRGKRRKTDDTPNPEVRAQKEKERRVSNNSRERMRIRDINDALTELGRVCMSLKPMGKSNAEKPQTKLGVLNMAVDVIMQLEKKVRERNLNPSNVALQHRGGASTTAPLPSTPQPQPSSQQSFQNSFQNMTSHQR